MEVPLIIDYRGNSCGEHLLAQLARPATLPRRQYKAQDACLRPISPVLEGR
jgi:hypothetical protein